jgi:glycosyltransferase involved in cell wall biosynthesis
VVKVLHVAQPTSGGVALYVADVAADQKRRGWDVTVAAPTDGVLASRLVASGVRHRPWMATRDPISLPTLREARALSVLITGERPDVVHLHSSKAGLAGRLAVRGRIPTLFQPHAWSWLAVDGMKRRAARAWERWAAGWAVALVCVGDAEAEVAARAGVGRRVVVVPNGVDITSYRRAGDHERERARDDLGIPPQCPLAVCVGRMARQKGQDVLLAAWPQIKAAVPEAHLALVGEIGGCAARSDDVSQLDVRFVPAVDDVRPWYMAADVVVVPSRWEGLSLTVLEAMASGRSVVVSDVPGLGDAVPVGAGGRIPAEDPARLAREVQVRLEDRQVADREGLVGAAHVARQHNRSTTLEKLASLTDQVAKQSRQR